MTPAERVDEWIRERLPKAGGSWRDSLVELVEAVERGVRESPDMVTALDMLRDGYVDADTCDGSEYACPGCRAARILRVFGRVP